jgi:hypothetical protein
MICRRAQDQRCRHGPAEGPRGGQGTSTHWSTGPRRLGLRKSARHPCSLLCRADRSPAPSGPGRSFACLRRCLVPCTMKNAGLLWYRCGAFYGRPSRREVGRNGGSDGAGQSDRRRGDRS